MRVFLDFEASSLSKNSYPIEVAWVFENGQSETYLIRPAPDWTEWDAEAERIHNIALKTLVDEGVPHDIVAQRMVEALSGHELFASAPSWDGKWLSTLLRSAGLPRHTLRLRDSDAAFYECAAGILAPHIPAQDIDHAVRDLLALTEMREANGPPAHRALPDALEEQQRWRAIGEAARAMVASAQTR